MGRVSNAVYNNRVWKSVFRHGYPNNPRNRAEVMFQNVFLHIQPVKVFKRSLRVSTTFGLGLTLAYLFLLLTLTGFLLMFYYIPHVDRAYQDMKDLEFAVSFGVVLRNMHRWAAHGMVAFTFLHMARVFYTGAYKAPREFNWFIGIILMIVTLFLSLSGYLLPWDQLSLWAVTIGVSMVEAIPPEVVGRTVNLLFRGAPEFGANGLLRWYLLHVVALPLAGIIFVGVHYYKVVLHGHSLPPDAEEVGEDTARRVPTDSRTYFFPHIATRELYYVVALTALITIGALFIHAPLEPHADPLVTPLHSTAPWYFLWLQGMLKLGDKVIFGLIVPGVLIGGLLVLPYVEVGPSRRYGSRRIGLTAGLGLVFTFGVLSYMGSPWFAVQTSPEQEAVAELLPQTHPGPLRLADWGGLAIGTYEASAYDQAPTATLQSVLDEFEQSIEGIQIDGRSDYQGIIVIEDWQTNLKKLTLRILWTDDVTGKPGEYSQTVYLHKDSNYGQGE